MPSFACSQRHLTDWISTSGLCCTPTRVGSTPYASLQQRLQKCGLVQSISRKGTRLDNAAMESFFGTLKCELFYFSKFKSIQELKEALHEYIHYYNVYCIKLGLTGLSPVAYRLQGAATAV